MRKSRTETVLCMVKDSMLILGGKVRLMLIGYESYIQVVKKRYWKLVIY